MPAFDRYVQLARTAPGVIVLSPVCLAYLAWAPETVTALSVSVPVLVALAATSLLSHLARDEGGKKQATLFAHWGGAPTTRFLRHSDTTLQPTTKARYHDTLGQLLPQIRLPTKEQEEASPQDADELYASCTAYLREITRRPEEFPLIHAANSEFGFRRNLWAMKPAAIVMAGVSTTVAWARVGFDVSQGHVPNAAGLLDAAGCAWLFALWAVRFTPNWVRVTADAYALRLLGALDTLKSKTPTPAPSLLVTP